MMVFLSLLYFYCLHIIFCKFSLYNQYKNYNHNSWSYYSNSHLSIGLFYKIDFRNYVVISYQPKLKRSVVTFKVVNVQEVFSVANNLHNYNSFVNYLSMFICAFVNSVVLLCHIMGSVRFPSLCLSFYWTQ